MHLNRKQCNHFKFCDRWTSGLTEYSPFSHSVARRTNNRIWPCSFSSQRVTAASQRSDSISPAYSLIILDWPKLNYNQRLYSSHFMGISPFLMQRMVLSNPSSSNILKSKSTYRLGLFRSDEVSRWINSEESSKTNPYLYHEEATGRPCHSPISLCTLLITKGWGTFSPLTIWKLWKIRSFCLCQPTLLLKNNIFFFPHLRNQMQQNCLWL